MKELPLDETKSVKDDDSGNPKQEQTYRQTQDVPAFQNHQDSTNAKSKADQEPSHKDSEIKKPMARSEKLMLLFTAIIALATLIYAGIAYYQWGIMSDQLAEIRSGSVDTKALAESAKKQAENTVKLAESAVKQADASIAGVRAWITSTTWDFLGMKDSRYIFAVVFKNIGKTPALGVVTNWEFTFVLNRSPKPNFSNCPTNTRLEFRPGNISVESSWRMEFNSDQLSEAQMKMLESRIATLYINGCAQYRDIIAHQLHVTQAVGFFPSNIGAPGRIGVYDPYTKMN